MLLQVVLVISTSLISTIVTHNTLRNIPSSVYGCYHGHEGTFFWRTYGSILSLNISSKITEEDWVAIGFSLDNKMGNDDVIAIHKNQKNQTINEFIVSSLYNPNGYTTTRLQKESSIMGSTVQYRDGVVSADITKSIPLSKPITNLDKTPVYLFFSTGRINTDNSLTPLHRHYVNPKVTRHTVLLNVKKLSCVNTATSLFIKIHGLMMVIIWLNLTLLTLYVARYAKFYFKVQSFWFTLHRAIGICTVLGVIIGVICAFIGVNKSWEFEKHQNMGVIIMLTLGLHISVAIFRPAKDTKHRRLWEYTHRVVGLVLQLFSIGNIVNGLYMLKVHVACYWALSIQIVYYCLLFITMENPQRFRSCINWIHNTTGLGTYFSLNSRYHTHKPLQMEEEGYDDGSDVDDITMLHMDLDQPTTLVDFTRLMPASIPIIDK